MSTLITGGTSQIGLELAKLLKDAGKGVVIAGRSPDKVPSDFKHVLLDWYDPSTFESALTGSLPIENLYIVPPLRTLEPIEIIRPFLDLAVEKGVKFFVFISSSDTAKGQVIAGGIHKYLDDKGVAFLALRATWFTENIFNVQASNVREKGEIVTCAANARIPFVSIRDIAQAAFDAIVDHPREKEQIVIGPELLTYSELASLLEGVVGKPIIHKVIPYEEKLAIYVKLYGFPEEFAKWLAGIEVKADHGADERLVEEANKYVGKLRVIDVLEQKREFWA